jgi:hypothetical protein
VVFFDNSSVDLVNVYGAADANYEDSAFNEINDSVEEDAVRLLPEEIFWHSAAATPAEDENENNQDGDQ